VAVDATSATVMGLEPTRVPYLAQAGEFLGNVELERVEQRGEDPERLRQEYELLEPFRSLRESLTSAG
jgi:hypothetical protein